MTMDFRKITDDGGWECLHCGIWTCRPKEHKYSCKLIVDLKKEIKQLKSKIEKIEYDPCDGCLYGCNACMCFRAEEQDKKKKGGK